MKYSNWPWKLHEQGDANEFCILGNDNRWVAGFRQNGEFFISEQRANAQLMAASPELYEALKNLIDDLKLRAKIGQKDAQAVVACGNGVFLQAISLLEKLEKQIS